MMGFLDVGETLEWDKAKQHARFVSSFSYVLFVLFSFFFPRRDFPTNIRGSVVRR